MNKEKASSRMAGKRSLFMRKLIGIVIASMVIMPLLGAGTASADSPIFVPIFDGITPSNEFLPLESIPLPSTIINPNWSSVTYSVYANDNFIGTATKDPADNQYYTSLDTNYFGLQHMWVSAEHDSVVDSVYFDVTITKIRSNWFLPLIIYKGKAPFSLSLNQLIAFDSSVHPVIDSATSSDSSILVNVNTDGSGITLQAKDTAVNNSTPNITVNVKDDANEITKQVVIPITINDISSISGSFTGMLQARGRPLAVELPSSGFRMEIIPAEASLAAFLTMMVPVNAEKFLASLHYQHYNLTSSSAVIPTTDLQDGYYICMFIPSEAEQVPLVQTMQIIDLGDASRPDQRVGIDSIVKYLGKTHDPDLANPPERYLDLIEPIVNSNSMVPISIGPPPG